ncbi:hypothetical protein FXO38_29422 [Capsicum annuum]|nr:hypothetical protein FXO38_29422 [Capsicum annuum]
MGDFLLPIGKRPNSHNPTPPLEDAVNGPKFLQQALLGKALVVTLDQPNQAQYFFGPIVSLSKAELEAGLNIHSSLSSLGIQMTRPSNNSLPAHINHELDCALSKVTLFTDACASNDGRRERPVLKLSFYPFPRKIIFLLSTPQPLTLFLSSLLMAHPRSSLAQPEIFISKPLERDRVPKSWLELCLSHFVIPLTLQLDGRTFIIRIQDPHYLAQMVGGHQPRSSKLWLKYLDDHHDDHLQPKPHEQHHFVNNLLRAKQDVSESSFLPTSNPISSHGRLNFCEKL